MKHDLGPKVRIGKYRPKKGYKRHNGHRSRITQIEIESIGSAKPQRRQTKKLDAAAAAAEETTEEKDGA